MIALFLKEICLRCNHPHIVVREETMTPKEARDVCVVCEDITFCEKWREDDARTDL